jgi:hypothetical protein
MLFPAAYVMMVIPQWVELPTARQAGEKTEKICRLDSIREPHEFAAGRDHGWAGPSVKPTAVDYPSSTATTRRALQRRDSNGIIALVRVVRGGTWSMGAAPSGRVWPT